MALSQSLRDIQQRLRQVAQTGGAGGAADQQKQMQKLIQAKGGKAVAGGGPKASALQAEGTGANLQAMAKEQALQGAIQGEQLGVQATAQQDQFKAAQERLAAQKRMALGEMGVKGQLSREEMASGSERQRRQLTANEQMKINQMASTFQNRTADLASQKGIAIDDLFADYNRSNEQLEFRKEAAELEQAAFDLDMANQNLLREYNAIWQTQNLQDELTFKREYAKMQMGEQTSALLDELGWRQANDADVRTFQDQVGQMSIHQAIAIADASIKDSQSQMIANGVFSGISAAATADWKSPKQNTGQGPTQEAAASQQMAQDPFWGSDLNYATNWNYD